MKLVKKTKLTNNGVLRTPVYEEVPDQIKNKLGERALAILQLKTTNTDGQYLDADEVAMDRLDRVISVGIAKVLIAGDPNNPLWDSISFPWMDANNQAITITLRQAIELQENALTGLSELWFPA